MKRITDLSIASEYNVALLPTAALIASETLGDINIIDLDTNLAAVPATVKRAAFITLCADSDGNRFLDYSEPMNMGEISSFSGVLGAAPWTITNAYTAAQAKTMTVVTTGLTVTIGTTYSLILTDAKDYNYIPGRRIVSFKATAATVDNVGQGLADAINADVSLPNVVATYTAGTDTILITGQAVSGASNVMSNFRAAHEILFDVIAGDNMELAVIATTNLPDPGCGTVREVSKLEEVYKGNRGHMNRVHFTSSTNIQYKAASNTSTGYDMFVVEHNAPFHTNTEGSVPAQIGTTVAIDEAAANSDGGVAGQFEFDFHAVLAALK